VALQQAAGRIATLCAQLQEALQGVLQALRPTMLDRFGLGAALEALVAQPRRREVDGALPACTLHLPAQGLEALPADMAVHVYRIVQEGLTNAVRHGEARTVQVEMQTQMRLDRSIDPQAALVIDIADDGRGPGPDGPVPGHGLLGLHERVQALGGTLALDRPEAGGLRLRVRLPIRPPVATEDRT
jgi:protein-histidine pros-kinase